MTKSEIIAELRRSALEDARPWIMIKYHAYEVAREMYTQPVPYTESAETQLLQLRMFFLLVAEALK